jgi:hypothetical protein
MNEFIDSNNYDEYFNTDPDNIFMEDPHNIINTEDLIE